MKKFLFVLVAFAMGGVAHAQSASVELKGAECAVATSDDGDSARTESSCATSTSLPYVRFNYDGYGLIADLATGEIGVEYLARGNLILGLRGSASTSKAGGDESHDSSADLYVSTWTQAPFSSGWVDWTLGVTRHQAVGNMDSNGAYGSTQYYFVNRNFTPFAELEAGYDQSTKSDARRWSTSLSLGIFALVM